MHLIEKAGPIPLDTVPPLVAFYVGAGLDGGGRTFEQVLALSDRSLESIHDYIQWIFPILTPSEAVPNAPQIDAAGIHLLRSSEIANSRMLGALARMLVFYGLRLEDDPDEPEIYIGPNFDSRSSNWLQPGNHNYKRVTRILISLQILGKRAYAIALFDCLSSLNRQHGGKIGSAYSFWRKSVGAK